MTPGSVGGSDKRRVQTDSFCNQGTFIGQISAVIDQQQVAAFIKMRCQRKCSALKRAFFSFTYRCTGALQVKYFAVPAFGKFIFFSHRPTP